MPVTFTNALGMSVSLLDYGATLTAMAVPDRHGALANIVLGLPDEAAYRASANRWGVMGRYAGRLSTPNGILLHGGDEPYDQQLWARRDFEDCCSLGAVFGLKDRDGVRVELTYRLMREENRLRLEYRAESPVPVALNLTNHVYLNLAGAGSEGVATHRLTLAADHYAETDGQMLPTGRFLPVAGTPLDFRHPAPLAERLAALPGGFDHSYLFRDPAPGLKDVLTLEESVSGRRLDMATTVPSLQFYTGGVFDGIEIGASGRAHRPNDALAFEAQFLPDSPSHPHFPSTELGPARPFHSVTSYRFSVFP